MAEDDEAGWDEAFARQLIGKTMLVGITHRDPDGSETGQEQYHGIIVEADPHNGIVVACRGEMLGERYALPPDLSSLQPASPGEYRLRSTGEVVVDPDYISTWTVHRPTS